MSKKGTFRLRWHKDPIGLDQIDGYDAAKVDLSSQKVLFSKTLSVVGPHNGSIKETELVVLFENAIVFAAPSNGRYKYLRVVHLHHCRWDEQEDLVRLHKQKPGGDEEYVLSGSKLKTFRKALLEGSRPEPAVTESGGTAAHRAVAAADVDELAHLNKADLLVLHENRTPLMRAVELKNGDMVRVLLAAHRAYQVHVNTRSADGETALHIAAREGDTQILTGLLDFPQINVNAQNERMWAPLHHFCRYYQDPSSSESIVEAFVRARADVNISGHDGECPLHKALQNARLRMIVAKALIDHGANVNGRTDRGETPLHWAVRLDRLDVVTMLCGLGADLTIPTTQKSGGREEQLTCVQLAVLCENGEGPIARYLLKVDELRAFLAAEGLENHLAILTQNALFLDVLHYSTNQTLKALNVPIGDCVRLLNALGSPGPGPERHKKTVSPSFTFAAPDSLDTLRGALGELARSEIDGRSLEFMKKLGSGASADVFEGRYTTPGGHTQLVAIKSMKEVDDVDALRKELKIITSFNSPYLVAFTGLCFANDRTHIVMELCARGSLKKQLGTELSLSWPLALKWLIEMCAGLYTLHAAGVYHRDFKSENCLIDEHWNLKIADFGLARTANQTNLKSLQGIRGTPGYWAPELFEGTTYSPKADIFSMGIVFWEVIYRTVVGRYIEPFSEFPWYDRDNPALMMVVTAKMTRDGGFATPTVPATTPASLAALYVRTVKGEPEERPEAQDVLADLRTVLTQFQSGLWGHTASTHEESSTVDDLEVSMEANRQLIDSLTNRMPSRALSQADALPPADSGSGSSSPSRGRSKKTKKKSKKGDDTTHESESTHEKKEKGHRDSRRDSSTRKLGKEESLLHVHRPRAESSASDDRKRRHKEPAREHSRRDDHLRADRSKSDDPSPDPSPALSSPLDDAAPARKLTPPDQATRKSRDSFSDSSPRRPNVLLSSSSEFATK